MRVVVFGAGMQGRVVAADLAARGLDVTVADVRAPSGALPRGVAFLQTDALRRDEVARAAKGADACALALPGEMARRALEHLVDVGAPTVDVSFTPDPPLDLDARARASGASVLVDVGIAPGLSHALAARAHAELGGLDTLRILVGGLPLAPPPRFRHAVYFNPRDLVAEYVRPARCRRGARDEAPHPLDAPPTAYEDPELGRLDAFLSDGLRTLLTSFPDVPEMEERTLRWPGHLDFMHGLREARLLEEAPLPGAPEPAADATARALAAAYPAAAHPDALLLVVEGTRAGRRVAWRLLDRAQGGLSAMSRTTAFTTAAVTALVARGRFREPGVHPPERLGAHPPLVDALLADLAERGVRVAAG